MEGGAIVESQISASSVHYGILGLQRWGPELARLNNQGIVNAWTSAAHDRNPWIEVRYVNSLKSQVWPVRAVTLTNTWPLVNNRLICRRRCVWPASSLRVPVAWAWLSTSRPSRWRAALMETLTPLTKWMANGETRLEDIPCIKCRLLTMCSPYQQLLIFNSRFHRKLLFLQLAPLISCVCVLQVFVGNTDNDSTKTNLFDPPIVAQYVRIIPVICRKACTLRMELVGCGLNGKHAESIRYNFKPPSKFRNLPDNSGG